MDPRGRGAAQGAPLEAESRLGLQPCTSRGAEREEHSRRDKSTGARLRAHTERLSDPTLRESFVGGVREHAATEELAVARGAA